MYKACFLSFFVYLLSLQAQAQEGDTIVFYQETKPSYPGGDEAIFRLLSERIVYPEEAKKEGVGGRVYVSFVVDTLGNVMDVHVERGLMQDIDDECVRVVRMLNGWEPGTQKGKKVKVQYRIPITFTPPKRYKAKRRRKMNREDD